MSVDFYPCAQCEEVFTDCGPHGRCVECEEIFCQYCVDDNKNKETGEIDKDSCRFCTLKVIYSCNLLEFARGLLDISMEELEDKYRKDKANE